MSNAAETDPRDRHAEALERQAEALEAIATEVRYQNAVLVETISAIDELARRVDDHCYTDADPPNRSTTALQTAVSDHLYERDENEDNAMSTLRRAENWGDSP